MIGANNNVLRNPILCNIPPVGQLASNEMKWPQVALFVSKQSHDEARPWPRLFIHVDADGCHVSDSDATETTTLKSPQLE